MLLHMIELNYQIDEVVWCDTTMEFPALYDHIEKVKEMVEHKGIKFTSLKSNYGFIYYLTQRPTKIHGELKNGCDWPNQRYRWCTYYLKNGVIDNYFKELKKECNIIQYVGIASDEQHRAKLDNPNKKYPLIEWDWTENDALEYCYQNGYDFGGLYHYFGRVSCWCCPLQSLKELRILRKNFPELWSQLLDMQNMTRRKFRTDYSVQELDKRFDFEEERLANGLSITNREFHKQLKNLLKP